ncbi:beta-fructofuranosidase [Alkalithermobacter thermoalcaliphilus JW-YL-7 = DSM 7308]|uniref:Sucrose-6-phosphate hydrolase n=1 Tax=Alkalithermobacter thermoalcaliphilus JW-YL-7 = DSM 7308 TaxID=1121328 RepID=A0A150FTN6_CLOPD|nr:sucrose-6-phosphate hydrolase [[Clostridium] paradoxum JW-YL-7 = DSM 7308]SHK34249.1 beta-fructofuranosidase [[Clostridium] paradoxum JW-YL-7 = DSM 7308]
MIKNEDLIKKANKEIEKNKSLVNSDYYRLKYHIMPPTGLLNDPNGFIQFKGEYHLFYQFHPFGTNHGLKYWGHYKSIDLVNWEAMPIALAPSEWYESHGCYSGSAIEDNGILTLIYTGNVKDKQGNRETYQCLAMSEDGVEFEKYKDNPVIHNQPKGYTRHFRDPKVWKKDGIWYMVIGAQTIKEEGRVLLFKSKDLKSWDMVGEVAGSNINNLGDFGFMWECPDLFELNGKDILISSPQGIKPQGDLYNNIYQSGYFVGKVDYKTGNMQHEDFVELDRGFEFYAPQTTLDDKGRRILIAWMGLPEEEDHPTTEKGWIHAMTIPRVLELKENKIIQKPVEEMENIRKNLAKYENIKINSSEIMLENISGDVLEMEAIFEVDDAYEFGVKLRCSDDEKEKTILYYDRKMQKFIFDRENSGKGYKGVRRCYIEDKKKLKLNIFLDTSSVEVFINDGQEVFTGRIYPDKQSLGIKFFAKGGSVILKELRKWDIKPVF